MTLIQAADNDCNHLPHVCVGSRWAGLADKDSSEDDEEDEAAAARAAAARTEAIKRQLKEQLTAILLEVTDRMFGKRCISSNQV